MNQITAKTLIQRHVNPAMSILLDSHFSPKPLTALSIRSLYIGCEETPMLSAPAVAFALYCAELNTTESHITPVEVAGVLTSMYNLPTTPVEHAALTPEAFVRIKSFSIDEISNADRFSPIIKRCIQNFNTLGAVVLDAQGNPVEPKQIRFNKVELSKDPTFLYKDTLLKIISRATFKGLLSLKETDLDKEINKLKPNDFKTAIVTLTDAEYCQLLEMVAYCHASLIQRIMLRSYCLSIFAIAKGGNCTPKWLDSRFNDSMLGFNDPLPIDTDQVNKFHQIYIARSNIHLYLKSFLFSMGAIAQELKIPRILWTIEQSKGIGITSLKGLAEMFTLHRVFNYSFFCRAFNCESEFLPVIESFIYSIVDPYSTVDGPKHPASSYKILSTAGSLFIPGAEIRAGFISNRAGYKKIPGLPELAVRQIYETVSQIKEVMRDDTQVEVSLQSLYNAIGKPALISRAGVTYIDNMGTEQLTKPAMPRPYPANTPNTIEGYKIVEGTRTEYTVYKEQLEAYEKAMETDVPFESMTEAQLAKSKRFVKAGLAHLLTLSVPTAKDEALFELAGLFNQAMVQKPKENYNIEAFAGSFVEPGIVPDHIYQVFKLTAANYAVATHDFTKDNWNAKYLVKEIKGAVEEETVNFQ